jgi:hypothetical protein
MSRAAGPQPSGTPLRVMLIAAASALAPFVVQTATLIATRSSGATAVVGLALALAFIGLGLGFFAREAGSLRDVPTGTRIGLALAVLTYHLIAFPIAHLIDASLIAR